VCVPIWAKMSDYLENSLTELSQLFQQYELAIHYSSIIIISHIFGYIGWSIITILRRIYKNTTSPLIVSVIPILSPIFVYIFFIILSYFSLCTTNLADAASFSYMVGILWKLSENSTGIDTIRLCIHVFDLEEVKEIWLKNSEVTVSEAITMIANVLQVRPGKVSIESGKGKFIDRLDAPLVPLIADDTVNEDLFGFSTVHCYVTVLHEQTNINLEDHHRRGSLARVAMNIMEHRGAIRYGLEVTLVGRIPNAANDSKAFEIRCVEMYAAASPSGGTFVNSADIVRFIGWREATNNESSNNSVAKLELSLSGQKIQNGDYVVLENQGKYVTPSLLLLPLIRMVLFLLLSFRFMSIARGKWIHWSSPVPRRSGAFVVEIIEKAYLNPIEKGIGKILNKEKDEETVLRTGDLFRLRSVKFPEFELGVTGERLTGEYFLLGLKRVPPLPPSSYSTLLTPLSSCTSQIDEDNGLCLGLQFTGKFKLLSNLPSLKTEKN
jgi:hypothetical protein